MELTQEEDEVLRDNEEGLVFDKTSSSDKPIVRGGLVEHLVERLTYFKYPGLSKFISFVTHQTVPYTRPSPRS